MKRRGLTRPVPADWRYEVRVGVGTPRVFGVEYESAQVNLDTQRSDEKGRNMEQLIQDLTVLVQKIESLVERL